MVLLILAGLAQAAPMLAPTWDPIPTIAELERDGVRWRIIEADEDAELLLDCPTPGEAPSRQQVASTLLGGTWVDAPVPPPLRTKHGWWLPAPGVGGRWWAVDRVDCTLSQRRLRTDAWSLDRLERAAATPATLREDALADAALADDPDASALLAGSEPWPRWIAVRPAGGFVRVRRDLRPTEGARAPLAPDGDRQIGWWTVEEDTVWTVSGPARVRVDARVGGVPRSVCLTVADLPPSCQLSWPAARPGPDLALHVDDATPGQRRTWYALLPAGKHQLSLDAAAAARLQVSEVDAFRALAPLPDGAHVFAERDLARALPAVAALPPQRHPALTLMRPSPWTDPEDPGVAWLPPEGVELSAAEELVTFAVLPDDGDAPCSVRFDDEPAWTSLARGAIVRAARRPTTAPSTLRAEGCEIRVRSEGSTQSHPERWVGATLARTGAATPVRLTWPLPHADRVRIRVHAQAPEQPLSVTVRTADGAAHTWTLSPSTRSGAWSPDGSRWGPAVELALDAPGPWLEVSTDGEAAVRVTSDALDVPDALLAAAPAPPATSLVALSRAIASDDDRVAALRARSALLSARGDARGAVRDALLAADIDPTTSARDAVLDLLADSREAWLPPHRWVLIDTAWLADTTDRAALERALRGDALSAARRTGSPRDWIVAARTQTLSSQDATRALADLVAGGVTDPEHPAFGAVRAWSRALGVPSIQGTRGVRTTTQASADDTDVAWPDAWEAASTWVLPVGWSLRLPAGALPALSVRCRARAPRATDAPCAIELRDTAGRLLTHAEASPWGEARPLPLDASRSARFLSVRTAGPADVEVLLPGSRPELVRDARQVTSGVATLWVRGPTVLELTAWGSPGPVSLRAGDQVVSGRADGSPMWLALREDALTEVWIEAPPDALLDAAIRTPQIRNTEPEAHQALLRSLRAPSSPEVLHAPAVLATPSPTGPSSTTLASREAPATRPLPVSLRIDARGGFGGASDLDVEETISLPARGVQTLTVMSRPGRAPVWVEGGVGVHEAVDRAAVVEGRFATEAWWNTHPVSGWIGGWTTLRTDTSADPLPVWRGRVHAGLSWRPRGWLDLRARVDLDGAWALRDPETTANTPQTVLWSDWRADHPLWVSGTAEVRTWPTSWLRVGAWARMRTNSPGDVVVPDSIASALDLRVGTPAFWGRVAMGVDHRPKDLDRPEAYDAPFLELAAEGTIWIRTGLAVQPLAQARWDPFFDRFSLDLGAALLWSTRRDQRDLRPTTADGRRAATWLEP